MFSKKALAASLSATEEPLYVENVFSTYLYTGNGLNQTISNGISLGSAYGGSAYFNGTNAYLSAPDNAAFDFGSGNFTIEFWTYLSETPGLYYPYFSKRTGPTYEPVSLLASSSSTLRLLCSTSGSGWEVDITTTTAVALNTWTHIAITRNGNVFTIWINGVDSGNQTTSGTLVVTTAPFYIGHDPGTGYYLNKAFISNFRVVKGTAVYTSSFTPSTSPLSVISGTALLCCQGPNVTTDSSANAFTLTASNVGLYTGYGPFTNSSLAQGGMVWIKERTNPSAHAIVDSAQGINKLLSSNTTAGADTTNAMVAFNSDGFTVKYPNTNDYYVNRSSQTYASWTFRKAEKFFDVVTYTGNATAGRTISHNLGSTPGCIFVKRLGSAENWAVWHRGLSAGYWMELNTTGGQTNAASADIFGNGTTYVNPTSTVFTVGSENRVNDTGSDYVAYLFAHDAGGFGEEGDQSVVKCGSFTASSNLAVNLGWEPQFVILKASSTTGNWLLMDDMRGMPVGSNRNDVLLRPNTNGAETDTLNIIDPTATGFTVIDGGGLSMGATYIYIAIRRGPMKTPEVGTEVFSVNTYTGDGSVNRLISSNFVTDFALITDRTDSSYAQRFVGDRLRGGGNSMSTTTTYPEGGDTGYLAGDLEPQFRSNQGILVTVTNTRFNASSKSYVAYQMRRAPGFLDIVTYTGDGVPGRTVSHNLGAAPEMIIVKGRTGTGRWATYVAPLGATHRILVELTIAAQADSSYWDNTTPTSSVFSVGGSIYTNASGTPYVAYLFGSLPGISKVGSVVLSGSPVNVDCGFTNGARFVLLKCTSGTSPWLLWDTARGIVAGNDPYILLNSQTIENVDGAGDFIDPYSPGFTIASGVEAFFNSGTFIYLAIA